MGEPQRKEEASRDSAPHARRWSFGPAILDEGTLELRVNGAPVHLERKPLEMLLHLLRHAGEVVTKDELQAAVWPGRFLSESVLTNCASRLRDALGDDAQTIIKTVHRYGYRLIAPVTVEARATAAPPRFAFKPGDAPPQRPLWEFSKCLGAGGRGEVWLAHHSKTREPRVFKYALDGGALTSLKREITLYRVLREALPERDDYVALIDWNLDEAPYFIEAEYTAGGTLVEWAESCGGLAAVPLGTRLDLVIQLAEALAAAHSVGVLHKDLKPANILVAPSAERPRVKVGDFGSGGLLDPSTLDALGITQIDFGKPGTNGDASATPFYLAPEVLAGQPFTLQSDVYALGVVLYQLIVGDFRKPLAPGWEKEVADELLREDIASAAAGNPTDRFADAAELARRLRNLEQRRRERAAEREAQARAARERAEVAEARQVLERARLRRTWATATIGLLVLGLTAITVLFVQARRASQEAHAVSAFLLDDMLMMASPYQGPIESLTFKQVLDRTASVIDERFAAQPTVASQVHLALGQSYWWLRQPEAARRQFELAASGFERLSGPDDVLVLRAREGVARALLEGEDPKSSIEALDRIVARLAQELPPRHPRLIQVRIQAALAHAPLDRNRAITDLRALVDEAGQADWTALSDADRSFYFRSYGSRIEGRELAEDARLYLGTLLAKADRPVEAAEALNTVVAYYETRYGDGHYSTALARLNLASALIRSGRDFEAEPQLLRGLQDLQTWLGVEHEDTKAALFAAASLRVEQGRVEEALELYDEVARRCVASGCAPRLTHASSHMLALMHMQVGELKDAATSMRSAVASAERSFGAQAPETVYSRSLLASLLQKQGDLVGARETYASLLAACPDGGTDSVRCARWRQELERLRAAAR